MRPILVILTIICVAPLFGQSANQSVRLGYKAFLEGRHTEAAEWFRKAGEDEPGSFIPLFNEGGAWYETDSLALAQEAFQTALARATTPQQKASAYHNLGNVLLKNQQYQQSIEAFRQSLLHNPYDEDTRYNLAWAMSKLQQNQESQEQNQDNEEQEEQEQQEQQDQEQSQQDNQQEQAENSREQQSSAQPQMSQQQMEQLLKALEQEEQKIQQRLGKKETGTPTKKEKDW